MTKMGDALDERDRVVVTLPTGAQVSGDVVFHYTDTTRLPWIINSDELRPGRSFVGDVFPELEFLWASSNANGDGSASLRRDQPYRDGIVRHIRFTLPAGEFHPWSEVSSRYPAWTQEHIQCLERAAADMRTNPADWWCRPCPLPLSRVVSIEWRSWRSNRWAALPDDGRMEVINQPPWLAVRIGTMDFASKRVDEPDGRQGYDFFTRTVAI